MNNVEKTITKAQLKLEQRALKELKKSYEKAKHDIEIQISALNSRKDMQNLQSIIHQKKYQEVLLKQIEGVIDDLNKGQYETLQDFFEGSYSTGYIGSMYDLHNQGISLVIPIDPKKMVTAVMTDSKLSKNYYQSRILPENLSTLKRNVRQELTRGIASGKTWIEVAYQVASGMNSPFNRAMRDAMGIIRTEGHRINQQGFLDASHEAKDKGADVVKQWDSTLDGNTRPAHRIADGQIKELDEPFIVDGEKMDAPSIGGSARNVCNCRCQLLQRARWALDEVELKTLQDRANFFGLDKSQDFNDFRKKYLQLPKNADKIKIGDSSTIMDMEDFNSYMKYMKDNFNVTVSKDMKNLYFDGVKKSTKGFIDVINEFPPIKKYFEEISTSNSGMSSMSYYGTYSFNPNYYEEPEDWFSHLSKYATEDTAFYSTGCHEAGHLIELFIIKEDPHTGGIYDWMNCENAKEICSEALKNAKKQTGKKYNELIGDVSNYALSDRSECLAECVADYMCNGENANILSKEVWKVLKKRFGE